MKSKEKIWIQAAIDLFDMEEAKAVAEMAVKAGVDWVEVGTPLVYGQGLKAIDELVKIADGRPVIVDYKAADGCYGSFTQAAKHGAAYAVVLGVADDGSIREAITAARETGLKVMCDLLFVPLDKAPQRAKEVEALGVDAIFIHCGFDEEKHTPGRKQYDGAEAIVEAVNIPVGIAVDLKEDALEAVKAGVSWVTFGLPILSSPDNFEACKDYVETLHHAR